MDTTDNASGRDGAGRVEVGLGALELRETGATSSHHWLWNFAKRQPLPLPDDLNPPQIKA